MSNDQPHFIARKIQEAQRLAARPYKCKRCKDASSFNNSARLKDHALLLHKETKPDSPESPEWNLYLEEAKSSNKKLHDVQVAPEKLEGVSRSSSHATSMVPHAGDETHSRSTNARPITSAGTTYTESFHQLSLDQKNNSASARGVHLSPSASINPLKRSSQDSRTLGLSGGREELTSPRSRRAKTNSGGHITVKGSEYQRGNTGPKRLYNPEIDGTSRGVSRQGMQRPGDTLPLSRSDEHKQKSNENTSKRRSDPRGSKAPQVLAAAPQLLRSSTGLNENAEIKNERPNPQDAGEDDAWMEPEPELLLQPETRPISHDQLVNEVKGIYAGLVMVEAKCIDVDDKQTSAAQERDPDKRNKLSSEQWSALIALHKTLLHEHHDFFLASQHPAASPALSKLAAKYSMPARMWRHGIHAFLEVLRHRLPESLDFMLAFIYIAYSMMALLYETVSSFEDTWIECLGDLGRYRMAIEDDDIHDREVWSVVSRSWYAKAADKSPKIGRLYHHLAILARPYTIQQLSLYARALTCVIPFESARGSVMTLFTPVLEGRESVYQRSNTMEILYIKCHALLFTGRSTVEFEDCVKQLLDTGLIEKYISRANSKYKEVGVFAALSNIAALLQYGATISNGTSASQLRLILEETKALREKRPVVNKSGEEIPHPQQPVNAPSGTLTVQEMTKSQAVRDHASTIAFGVLCIVLRLRNNKNIFPMVHIYAVFIWYLSGIPKAMELIERDIPWTDLVDFLNTIARPETMTDTVRQQYFPGSQKGIKGRPLPEDFLQRGQLHTETYFSDRFFEDANIDDEERTLELPSFHAPRVERILWSFHRVAVHNRWISFDEASCTFMVTSYVKQLAPKETKGQLEPVESTRDADTLMSGMEPQAAEPSYQIPSSPSRRILTTEPTRQGTAQATIGPEEIKKESLVQTPKFILKRTSRPESRDVDMTKDNTIKQKDTGIDSGFGKAHEDATGKLPISRRSEDGPPIKVEPHEQGPGMIRQDFYSNGDTSKG